MLSPKLILFQQQMSAIVTFAGVLVLAAHYLQNAASADSTNFLLVLGGALTIFGFFTFVLSRLHNKAQAEAAKLAAGLVRRSPEQEDARTMAIVGALLMASPFVIFFVYPLLIGGSDGGDLGSTIFAFLAGIVGLPLGLILLSIGLLRYAKAAKRPVSAVAPSMNENIIIISPSASNDKQL